MVRGGGGGDDDDAPARKSQVELGPDAFKGNNGPFPDIEIVNCFSVVLRSKSFNGIQ